MINSNDDDSTTSENLQFNNIKEQEPHDDQNIFFIETGMSIDNVILTARQACAIESAALTNPHLNVFVIFASKERLEKLEKTSELNELLTYPNVQVKYMNVGEISKGSPIESFLKGDRLSKSKFKVEHTADVLRLMILWKYGGTYLDLDMVVQEKFDSVPPNFACLETPEFINNALINLDQKKGKEFGELLMDDLVKNYDENEFGHNGPELLTRVFEKVCKTNNKTEMVVKGDCDGFHVLPASKCYPVDDWKKLISIKSSDEAMRAVKGALTVHFTNHLSKKIKLRKSEPTAYVKLAQTFCPKVLSASKDNEF